MFSDCRRDHGSSFRPRSYASAARRPAPPPRRRRPKGPAATPPTVPANGKARRRMLKNAVRSLARMVGMPIGSLMQAGTGDLLLLAATRADRPGDARRLAVKIARLRVRA